MVNELGAGVDLTEGVEETVGMLSELDEQRVDRTHLIGQERQAIEVAASMLLTFPCLMVRHLCNLLQKLPL